jgi:hypothetical protein
LQRKSSRPQTRRWRLYEELKAANEELTLANHDFDGTSSDWAIQRAASEDARAELSAILAAIPDALAVIDRSGAVVRKPGVQRSGTHSRRSVHFTS